MRARSPACSRHSERSPTTSFARGERSRSSRDWVARDSPRIIKRKIVTPIRLEFQDISNLRPDRVAVAYISFRVSDREAEREGSPRDPGNLEKHALDLRTITRDHRRRDLDTIMSTYLSSIEI